MELVPDVHYAVAPDGIHIAYQVFGEGPTDLVLVWGGVSHIELFWEDPTLARIFRRLGTFARVIQYDRRGTGQSDRPPRPATVDERMLDISTVLDAVGSERAAVLGESEGAPVASLFAATHPERVSRLVLYGPVIRMLGDETYPWAPDPEVFAEALDLTVAQWGQGDLLWSWAPSVADDPQARRFFSRWARMSSSPGGFRAQMKVNAAIDVRPVLPLIGAPTLVLHRRDDTSISVGQGRYAAAHVPAARFVELPGEDHLLIGGDPEPFLDEIERFLTGSTSGRDANRVLATIVFTDIVGSTELAGRLGDRHWRELLDQQEAALRRRLPTYGGRQVRSTGDGMIASFTGPAGAVGWARAAVGASEALGLQIRAGIHTGECELRGSDFAGVSVHLAARITDLARPGEVLVSQTVRDLVAGSGVEFAPRGAHELKGSADAWPLFATGGC